MKALGVVALAAIALLVGCAPADAADAQQNSQTLVASADSGGTFSAATLAAFGSFEWKAAPSYTRLAVVRHNAALALRKNLITVEKAEQIQAQADAVRSKLDSAVAACKQSDKTAKCTGSENRANKLLASANADLAAIQ